MTITNKYENMTVTVSCNEIEDTEMMKLIQKMKNTKTAREHTEEFYLPRIKAIGTAKWETICNQLLNLCETTKEVGIQGRIETCLKADFCRDDNGERYSLRVSYNPHSHVYILNYGHIGCIYGSATLNPNKEYYNSEWGEDKDGWLVKWDEYNLYAQFRKNLMSEIERKIKTDEARIRSIQENYDEIAGK